MGERGAARCGAGWGVGGGVAVCGGAALGAYLAAVRDAGKCPSGARVRKTAEFLGWECAVLSHGWIATFHANE